MTSSKAPVGVACARLRVQRRLSQAQVAERMRAAGHRWSQQTVLKVEKGQRSVHLTEGRDLADIFAVSVDDLLAAGDADGDDLPPLTAEALAGIRIRNIRSSLRWSQRRLAAEMETRTGERLDPSTVCRIEAGEYALRVNVLVDIAATLGVPAEELLR